MAKKITQSNTDTLSVNEKSIPSNTASVSDSKKKSSSAKASKLIEFEALEVLKTRH
jgi:hypothetical protein